MKWCNKCKEWKDKSEFNKDKSQKSGLQSNCRECTKQKSREYREENREEINRKQREYDKENREEINRKQREYDKENREEVNRKHRERNNSPLPYSSTTKTKIETYEEIRESADGNIECKCTYCGQWFEPNMREIQNRLNAINGKGTGDGAEHRLYCSETCKFSCPTYHKVWYEEGLQPASSREVQPALRIMRFEVDNWTCQRCHRTRIELLQSNIPLRCHHIEGIQWKPLESADVDECITYCKECHSKVHQIEGCTPSDMTCPAEWKYNS